MTKFEYFAQIEVNRLLEQEALEAERAQAERDLETADELAAWVRA